jgi:hypothetical protein
VEGTDPVLTPIVFPNPVAGGYYDSYFGTGGPSSVSVRVILNQATTDLKIELFTTAYRKIASMNVGAAPVGVKNYPLPLRDLKGRPLSNGVYYVVVTSNTGSAIGKLMILK